MTDKEIFDYLCGLSHKKFVLHGSPHELKVLEPRQADGGSKYSFKNLNAVYASIVIHDAVIKAVIHGEVGWTFEEDDRTYVHGEGLLPRPGYIYVLDQKKFEKLPNELWFASHEPVEPLETFRVTPGILDHLQDIVLPSYMIANA